MPGPRSRALGVSARGPHGASPGTAADLLLPGLSLPRPGRGAQTCGKPAALSSLTRSPRHLPGLPGGRTEGPTRSRAPYMSVRCRRADSSLGTAVKWFPSRYLEERCRVTPGKGHGAHCRLLRAPSLAFRTRPGPRSRPSQRRCPLHGTHCACQLMFVCVITQLTMSPPPDC